MTRGAYGLALALALAAMLAFGVFVVRDYQEQAAPRVVMTTTGDPVTGDTGAGSGRSAGPTALPAERAMAGQVPDGAAFAGHAGLSRPVEPGSAGGAPTGSGASPTPAAPPGGMSPACVNGVIRIGQIVPITGPLTVQAAADAVAAYFKKVNAEGGINGCRVDFTYLDDAGLDQQKAAAAARQLVQEDNVFAIVGNFEPVTAAVTEPYFRRYGVPVVGTDSAALQEYGSPVEYSFAFSGLGAGIATANEAKRLGRTRLAVFYVDVDFLQVGFAALKEQAARNGQQIVYSNAENGASATYGTDVVAARNASPDVVINLLDANSTIREINAMSTDGWYPDLIGMTSQSDPVVSTQEGTWLSSPMHHIYSLRPYLPANAGTPEVREWLETEGRYFPGFDANSFAEGAWLGAKVFTELARRLGRNLSRDTLFAALNGMRGYHTGFTPDITMTPDHAPNRQVLWTRWDAGTQQYQQTEAFQPW